MGCHDRQRLERHIQRVEAKAATKHPAVHRTAAHATEKYWAQNINGTKVEKSLSRYFLLYHYLKSTTNRIHFTIIFPRPVSSLDILIYVNGTTILSHSTRNHRHHTHAHTHTHAHAHTHTHTHTHRVPI